MDAQVPAQLLPLRTAALSSLYVFSKAVLGYDKLVKRVHGPVCQALQDIGRPRVNITMPRKFYKSTVASICYPIWRVLHDHNCTLLLAMNTVDNAKLKLKELQNHFVSNAMFKACFPEVIPDDFSRNWSAESCTIPRTSLKGTPTFSVAGATTTVVSRAVDEIIMDDLLSAREDGATGDTVLPGVREIDQAIWWYKKSMSLLNDVEHGRLLNIGTRWAEKDLVEYVLRTSVRFRDNNISIEAKNSHGEAIMPEWYPIEALNEIEETQGSTLFNLWYMNKAVDPKEVVFRLDEDQNFYQAADYDADWYKKLRVYMAVDLAFSNKAKADNTAIVTVGVDDANVRYVLDVRYGHYQPTETIDLLFSLYETWKPRVIGIEAVAAQELLTKLLPHFMRERGVALPIEPLKRGAQAKEYRITLALEPWVQQRMLKLPRGMAKPLEVEMRDFRLDKKRRGHDDALDALADAVQLSRAAQVEPIKTDTRRPPTDDEWKAFYEKFYSLDAAVAELEGKSDVEMFCNPDSFSYLRRN